MYIVTDMGVSFYNYKDSLAEVSNLPASLILAQIEESLGRYYLDLKNKSKAINFITAAQKTFGSIGHQMGAQHMAHILDVLIEKSSELHFFPSFNEEILIACFGCL